MAANIKNSPENIALFKSYAAELMKSGRAGTSSPELLDTFRKYSGTLTGAERSKILHGRGYTTAVAKEIAQMKSSSLALRQNIKDTNAINMFLRSQNRLQSYRQTFAAAKTPFLKRLADEESSARGHANWISPGKDTHKVLVDILEQDKKSRKYLGDIARPFSGHAGFRSYHRAIIGGVSPKAGHAMGMLGDMFDNPLVDAAGIGAATAALPLLAIKAGFGIENFAVGKQKEVFKYWQNIAQAARYGGMGRGFFQNPLMGHGYTGYGESYNELTFLKKAFPQFKSGTQMAESLAALRIPAHTSQQAVKMMTSLNMLNMSGGAMGGLGLGQTGSMMDQLIQLGFARRSGGTVLGPQAAAATKSVYESALSTAIKMGFDKSQVAQSIEDSLKTMTQAGGGVSSQLPGGIFSLFAANRGISPGLSNPSNVVSATQTLTNMGKNILSHPATFNLLRNYVTSKYKSKNLLDSMKKMASATHNKQLQNWIAYGEKMGMNANEILTTGIQANKFASYIPAAANAGIPNFFLRFEYLLAHGFNPGQAQAMSTLKGAIPKGGAVTATPTGISQVTQLHKALLKSKNLQDFATKLKNGTLSTTDLNKYLKDPNFVKGITALEFFDPNIYNSLGGVLSGENPFSKMKNVNISRKLLGGLISIKSQKTIPVSTTLGNAVHAQLIAALDANNPRRIQSAVTAISALTTQSQLQKIQGVNMPEDLNTLAANVANLSELNLEAAQNWKTITQKMLNITTTLEKVVQRVLH